MINDKFKEHLTLIVVKQNHCFVDISFMLL